MKCDICKNYVYYSPTWQDPSYDEYCQVYGDFSNMYDNNIVCNRFEMNRYFQMRAIKNRINKLERILNDKSLC